MKKIIEMEQETGFTFNREMGKDFLAGKVEGEEVLRKLRMPYTGMVWGLAVAFGLTVDDKSVEELAKEISEFVRAKEGTEGTKKAKRITTVQELVSELKNQYFDVDGTGIKEVLERATKKVLLTFRDREGIYNWRIINPTLLKSDYVKVLTDVVFTRLNKVKSHDMRYLEVSVLKADNETRTINEYVGYSDLTKEWIAIRDEAEREAKKRNAPFTEKLAMLNEAVKEDRMEVFITLRKYFTFPEIQRVALMMGLQSDTTDPREFLDEMRKAYQAWHEEHDEFSEPCDEAMKTAQALKAAHAGKNDVIDNTSLDRLVAAIKITDEAVKEGYAERCLPLTERYLLDMCTVSEMDRYRILFDIDASDYWKNGFDESFDYAVALIADKVDSIADVYLHEKAELENDADDTYAPEMCEGISEADVMKSPELISLKNNACLTADFFGLRCAKRRNREIISQCVSLEAIKAALQRTDTFTIYMTARDFGMARNDELSKESKSDLIEICTSEIVRGRIRELQEAYESACQKSASCSAMFKQRMKEAIDRRAVYFGIKQVLKAEEAKKYVIRTVQCNNRQILSRRKEHNGPDVKSNGA